MPVNVEGPLVRREDRVLLLGGVLVGTQLLGLIGLVILTAWVVLLKRAKGARARARRATQQKAAFAALLDEMIAGFRQSLTNDKGDLS